MESKFFKEYNLRTSDFDCKKRIHSSSVLDLFQDIAGYHADALGCSGEVMIKKNLAWVLASVKFKIVKQPQMPSTVKVVTWPLPTKGVRFQRDYLVFDTGGELLIKGTSKWVFIDINKRSVAMVRDVYPADFTYCTDTAFEEKAAKIPNFDDADDIYTIIPQFTHLDYNGHVNNIKYADFIADALGENAKSIESLAIEYHREVKYHQTLSIALNRLDNEVLLKGTDKNSENMFSAKVILK